MTTRRVRTAPVAGYEFGPDATQRATNLARSQLDRARSVVVVEGTSDQIAVETLARRMGRDLDDDRVVVMPIGGAHAAGQVVPELLDAGLCVVGIVDQAEAGEYATAFHVSGDDFATSGVFVCTPDLEYELIRSFEPDELLAVLETFGDSRSFGTLQKQPQWRDRAFADQMHRWLRSISNRGPRYAQALIEHAHEHRLPAPLVAAVERAVNAP